MSQQFPALFKPLQIRHKTLRNRIVFGSHTANMSVDGLPGERHRGYYEERARGGVGMIVVEPVPVHRTAVLTRGNFRHSTDEVIPHFRKITDAVHGHGAVICNQLYHVGQHGDFDNSYEPSWSPSGLPSFHDSDGSHAMSEAEIDEIIESFVQAARRARDAGFDGIELFAAYNAIIDQFWLPFNNRRDDRWGGSFENRMRFSRTIMERIRKMAGEDFIIGLAVNMDPTSPVSQTIEQLQEVIAWHDERFIYHHVARWPGGMAADHKYAMAGVRQGNYLLLRSRPCDNPNCEEANGQQCDTLRSVEAGSKSATYTAENAQYHWGVTPPGRWALYDVNKDPGCMNDLAAAETERVAAMGAAYDKWWDATYPVMVQRGGDAEIVWSKVQTDLINKKKAAKAAKAEQEKKADQ